LIPDLDIYRAAKLLIDQHGPDARLNAAGRADLLLEEGDTEGAAVWRAIIRRSRSCGASVGWTRP
jgi:hypothetical protein